MTTINTSKETIYINEFLESSSYSFIKVGLSYSDFLENIDDKETVSVYLEEEDRCFVQFLGFEIYFEKQTIRYFKLLFYSEYKFYIKCLNEEIEISKNTRLSDMIEILNKLAIDWSFTEIKHHKDLYLTTSGKTQIIYSYADNSEELVHIMSELN